MLVHHYYAVCIRNIKLNLINPRATKLLIGYLMNKNYVNGDRSREKGLDEHGIWNMERMKSSSQLRISRTHRYNRTNNT